MANKTPAPRALAAVKAGPPAKPIDKQLRITAKVRRAIDLMATGECKLIKDAAEKVGLARESLGRALAKPHVVGFYTTELAALRTSKRAKNIHTLVRQTGPTVKALQAGGATSLPAIAAGLHEAGIDISDTRIWSVLTTAPGATADATDTRPRHAGMAADPFWYNVLESARAIVFDARAIVFEGCAATRPGIAILSRRATVRCRL